MARSDGRVEQGQKLSTAISARAWNRAQDAADIVLGVRPGTSGADGVPSPHSYNWIYVKMVSGSANYGDAIGTAAAFTYLDTTGTSKTLTDKQLFEIPILNGVVVGPGQDGITGGSPIEQTCSIGIAVEPIKQGSVGRVAVSGVLMCNVFCVRPWHSWAGYRPGSPTLQSSGTGHIQILTWFPAADSDFQQRRFAPITYKNDYNQLVTALVRIGNITPQPFVMVTIPSKWKKGQTKVCAITNGGSQGYNQLGVNMRNVLRPSTNDDSAGGIEVVNVLCDVEDAGIGMCCAYGDKWMLVNWTPTYFDVDNKTFLVPGLTK